MPIATPQGTLDFKSVDKVTFVGASSNTVIDTTTGSLGVGVGVGGPTSKLHVVGNAFISSDLTVSGIVGSSGTGALTVPNGTTGDRPAAATGMIRYNSTTGFMEGYAAAGWAPIAQPPTVTGISPLTTLTSGGNVEGFFNQTELIHPNMPVLTSGDNAYNYFGKSVSMTSDGTRAIVGVPYDDIGAYSSYTESGSAQVFKRTGTTWTWEAEFVDQHVNQTSVTAVATTYDRFGTSVAISDDGIYAVVGAPADNAPGSLNDAGSAQIYIRSGTTWTHQQLLYSNSPTALDFFGISVSINSDGTRALIGATQEAGTNTSAGSAEVWVRNTATNVWSYESNLTQATSSVDDHFGNSVRLSSDGVYAIVGAWKVSSGGDSENGEVVIFVRDTSTNNWTRQATFTINPQENWGAGSSRHGARFGHAVDINSDGTRVVVGAVNDYEAGGTNNGPRPGSADVWKRNTGESTWAFEARLDFPDTFTSSDSFGDSVSISLDGTRVAIGAPYHDRAVQNNTGAAYIFVRNTTTNAWTLKTSLYQTESEASALMGDSVALSGDGNYVLIGEPLKNITDLQNGSTAGTSAGKVGVYDFRSQVFDTSTQVFTATGTGIVSGSTVQLEGADGSLYSVSNVTPNAAGTQVTFKMGSEAAEFPPSAMSTNTSITGYTASASPGSNSGDAWKAFNDVVSTSSNDYWNASSGTYSTTAPYLPQGTGSAAPATTQDISGSLHIGHWIQLQIPNPVILTRAVIGSTSSGYQHGQFVILGSNDGTNWTLLHAGTGTTLSTNVTTLSAGSTEAFKYFRVVIKSVTSTTSGGHLELNNVQFFGGSRSWDLAQQPYKVKVNSTSGLIGTSTAKIRFPPTWTTAVDANLRFDISANTIQTLVGTDGGGGTNRTFSLAPGSNALPAGLTLIGSAITGQIAANQDGVTTSVTFRLTDNATGLFTDRAVNIVGFIPPLYAFTSPFTFLTGGVGGGYASGSTARYGPTISQVRSQYSTSDPALAWVHDSANYLNMTGPQGIQEWTVPESATYRIDAYGAAGGGQHQKGFGARMRGDFDLIKGEVIKILVGQTMGIEQSGGGGGGTFVVRTPYNTNASILVIAGGGGGQYNTVSLIHVAHAVTGTSGQTAQSGYPGGTNGSGGSGNTNSGAAGGGGFFGDGGSGTYSSPGGSAFVNGGNGGNYGSVYTYLAVGGFGGGGGTHGNTGGGGGGGGYSGGGGGYHDASYGAGGGGGSYNSGSNQSNGGGANSGNGQVIVTKL